MQRHAAAPAPPSLPPLDGPSDGGPAASKGFAAGSSANRRPSAGLEPLPIIPPARDRENVRDAPGRGRYARPGAGATMRSASLEPLAPLGFDGSVREPADRSFSVGPRRRGPAAPRLAPLEGAPRLAPLEGGPPIGRLPELRLPDVPVGLLLRPSCPWERAPAPGVSALQTSPDLLDDPNSERSLPEDLTLEERRALVPYAPLRWCPTMAAMVYLDCALGILHWWDSQMQRWVPKTGHSIKWFNALSLADATQIRNQAGEPGLIASIMAREAPSHIQNRMAGAFPALPQTSSPTGGTSRKSQRDEAERALQDAFQSERRRGASPITAAAAALRMCRSSSPDAADSAMHASWDRALDAALAADEVVVFGDDGSPFCAQAEDALRAHSIAFQRVPIIDHMPALKARCGSTSAPSVWVRGTYVGGLNGGTQAWHGVRKMLESGKLQEMVRGSDIPTPAPGPRPPSREKTTSGRGHFMGGARRLLLPAVG